MGWAVERDQRRGEDEATAAGVKHAALKRLERGAAVGRYVIVDFIDKGGMGEVYRAFDPELNRPVALKLVAVSRTSSEESLSTQKSRLLREAQALAQLSHPNVVTVYDVGPYENAVFMAMEFVEGETLRAALAARRLSRTQILEVMRDAGRGLAAAHKAGITHRDFKPSNVILGSDGRVRVIDFGLARAQADGPEDDDASSKVPSMTPGSSGDLLGSPLTVDGTVVGTPQYMAPEQFQSRRADPKSDQFSFCVVLFMALYGARPYDGDTVDAVADGTKAGLFERPKGSDVPEWLDRVVARGLRFDPAERYPSMEALLADLANDPAIAAALVRARRVRAALAGAALLSVGVAAWALVSGNQRQQRQCAAGGAKLAGVWDPTVRGAVERAFRATGRPYADDVFRTTSAALDRLGEAWVAMHKDACEATRVRGEQSEEVLTQRMACLDERLHQVKALTTLFSHADEGVLNKAADAVGRIDGVAACGDLSALSAVVKPPSDGATRAKVASIRQRLAEPRALKLAAKYQQGLALAEPLAAEATAVGYRPLVAEASLLVGELRTGLGEHKPAEQSLSDALLVAEEVKHDEVVAQALGSLAWSIGVEQSRHAEGLTWARLATAATKRLGGDDDQTVTILTTTSTIYKEQGKAAEAVPLAEEALAITLRTRGLSHVFTARTYNIVGNAYMENAKYPKAREAYLHALAIAERALGPQNPTVAAIINNLGILERRGGHFEDALRYYDRALAIHEATLGPDHPRVAETLNNKAKPLHQLGRWSEALACGQRALAIYGKRFGPDFPDAAYVLISIGQSYVGMQRAADAIPPLERALALIVKNTLARDLAGDGRFALAKAHLQLHHAAEAQKLARQAADDYAASPGSETDLAAVKAWLAANIR